ncbi:MAG TPA: NUDIX hydrolase [Clostridiales bacterium]|nr:NUDIX hydrolase [Clostridiales bacterium]
MSDNYFASVGAIVIKNNQVLLVRHTYGSAKGKLLNPGGHICNNELPFAAVKREVLEETGVVINPVGMLSIRCDVGSWYMVILAEYVSGEPKSDNNENDEALFMDCDEVLNRADATDTVKTHIKLALERKPLLPIDAGKGRVLFATGNT